MSRSLSRLQAVLLGLGVILGLGLGVFGLFSIGAQQWLWSKTFHLHVGFKQIKGVEPGTRVRVLGRDAGEVEAILLPDKPSAEVKLRLRIDAAVRSLIRNDAVAQIVPEGMIGGKVVDITPGSDSAPAVEDGADIAAKATPELSDLLAQVNGTLDGLGKGEGTLGKLVKDEGAYQELLRLMQQSRGAISSIQQNTDALKGMPLVRNYVTDPVKELVRPDCERNVKWFHEADLFEPGRAVLTAQGRQKLDELVPWLDGLKHKGSEVVLAAYAHPGNEADLAKVLTQKQSEAVRDYLTSHHAVQKLGWFSRRKVTALGCGADNHLAATKDNLPLPRIEVLVFVPQG